MQRLSLALFLATLLTAGCTRETPQDPRDASRRDGDTPTPRTDVTAPIPAANLADSTKTYDAIVSNLTAPLADNTGRRAFYEKEVDAALKDNNPRGAALAYEQILLLGDDPVVKKKLDDLRDSLTRYDDCRRRAAELRRDPANLEDAL